MAEKGRDERLEQGAGFSPDVQKAQKLFQFLEPLRDRFENSISLNDPRVQAVVDRVGKNFAQAEFLAFGSSAKIAPGLDTKTLEHLRNNLVKSATVNLKVFDLCFQSKKTPVFRGSF